jgi:hypothetical protein
MHFGKTYASILASLPPDLQADAIEYRTLKKIIRLVVAELDALGLGPEVLHRIQIIPAASAPDSGAQSTDGVSKAEERGETEGGEAEVLTGDLAAALHLDEDDSAPVQVLYELATRSDGVVEPRLRLRLPPRSPSPLSSDEHPVPG